MITPETAKLEFLRALNKAQGLMEPIKKDSDNPHFRSRYASLAAVNEAVMGPLAEAGFVIMQGGVDVGGKPYLRTTLAHVGGHSEYFDYPLLVSDSNPQHLASATTYARRYAICALLNLSTEDDDGNTASDVKTVTRQAYVPTDAPAKTPAPSQAATQPSSDVEYATFIPTDVQMVPGKGKGEGQMFSEIFDGKTKYSGDEIQGQLAISALDKKKEIVVGFTRNGRYLNIKRGCVKMAEAEKFEEVPF